MRILMLSPTYPLPPNSGAKRRIHAVANQLAQNNHLTLAALRQPNECMPSTLEPWLGRCVDLRTTKRWSVVRALMSNRTYREVRFHEPQFHSLLDELFEKGNFDIIWLNFLDMATYLERQIFSGNYPALLVLDQHNLDEKVWRSYIDWGGSLAHRIFSRRELAKVKKLQKRWFSRFDLILSVSQSDLEGTKKYVSERTEVFLAPNGVDTDYFNPRSSLSTQKATPVLVFGGSMNVTMNQDAVHWFIKSIYPLVKQKVQDVEFWIVGQEPPPTIQILSKVPGIRVTGTVHDVRDFFGHADVFVVPLRLGGGTKLKTLEAMAMGLPIVSTSIGAQGLELEPGRQLHIADDPAIFAARVVELLRDRSKAVAMGAEACRLAKERYSWERVMSDVEKKLSNLLAERGKP